jgi:hypothetical protein
LLLHASQGFFHHADAIKKLALLVAPTFFLLALILLEIQKILLKAAQTPFLAQASLGVHFARAACKGEGAHRNEDS